jgi:hypothetical protein
MNILAAHHFRSLDSRRHGSKGCFDVHHHTLPHSRGGTHPHTGNFEGSVFIALTNHSADLCRANVEADN